MYFESNLARLWLTLAESRKQAAYERCGLPSECLSAAGREEACSFNMAKYHTRAQYWCTFQLGCYVHAIFLLSDTTTSQTSNVIIRELYLESRQVDLGDREAGGGQQS